MVLVLPFLIKKVEHNLEIFLFVMGCIAMTVSSAWNLKIVHEALVEPIKIAVAVFIAGILFQRLQPLVKSGVDYFEEILGIKLFVLLLIILLGILSSVITAIIAALFLVEIINVIKLDRKSEVKIVVLACFSIGIGAALTPIGEPLSTILVAKLKDAPYYANFWFPFTHFAVYILPGILVIGAFSWFITERKVRDEAATLHEDEPPEGFKDVLLRTAKVYLFVMALIFLGTGFRPVIDLYIIKLPSAVLYWVNMISAILDNATLVAAEISPGMEIEQIKDAVMALIISGGMLIPGNIPNIISANKLKIGSREWAMFGVPVGLVLMVVYFIVLMFIK